MSRRDGADDDEGMGSGEQLVADPEDEERRARFEGAARQGPDQLAAVLNDQIMGLAEEFEARTERVVKGLLEGIDGSPDKPQGFIRGAIFGAIVLAAGVLLGRR